MTENYQSFPEGGNRAGHFVPLRETLSLFGQAVPADIKDKLLINRRIEQVQKQFAQVADPFILEHVNSLYLTKSKMVDNAYDLVVYVDNSMCAAELNARRELIRLKYRELFDVVVDVFDIRISRNRYRNDHPFVPNDDEYAVKPARDLTDAECREIDGILAPLPEGPMRDSFERAMKALKSRS